MNVGWRIYTNAKSEENAESVLNRFKAELGAELKNVRIDEHHRGGHAIKFDIELAATRWTDAVCEAIEVGQRVGYGWSLSGSVIDDPSADCIELRVPGIASASWHLTKAG